MYGTQTSVDMSDVWGKFENDVEMYGTQTVLAVTFPIPLFENDVEMYGTQTACFTKVYFTTV